MSRPFPIVEYAHKINKNTAEFTVNDLVAFMKWWTKQPERKDILAMKSQYDNKKREQKVKGHEEEQEQESEVVVDPEVVAEIGLTRNDIDALKWALTRINEDYELSESVYGKVLMDLLDTLNGA